jgi:arylsulfatase
MDVMPTCLDLAGAKYPERFKGHEITSLDGKSLLPILKDRERDGHDMLFFEHVGGKAVVDGEWKLVQPTRGKRWRLYHLATDRTETRDLADKHPERVRKMKKRWHDWAARVGAE